MTRVAALCAGYGGLEMGLGLAGVDHELVWWSEIDPAACTVMAAHTTAPNLGDLRDITDPPPADVVCAGFPCQPFSTAGQRRGVDDERWLIDDVCRVARLAGAQRLILENVDGLLTANGGDALARVCAALAREGFRRWEWGTVRASDVGAPHRRKRWFCVADTHGPGRQGPEPAAGRHVPAGSRGPAADTDSGQPERRRGPGQLGSTSAAELGQGDQRERAGHTPSDRCSAPAHTDGGECQGRDSDPPSGCEPCPSGAMAWGPYAAAVEQWAAILRRPAPAPTVAGRLNPRAVEWMMGLPDGWVTDCDLPRTRQLHVLGNGVVPQQAAAAIRELTTQDGGR